MLYPFDGFVCQRNKWHSLTIVCCCGEPGEETDCSSVYTKITVYIDKGEERHLLHEVTYLHKK